MSRIGSRPVPLPEGVKVDVSETMLSVKGPKGELSMETVPSIEVAVEEGRIVVTRNSEEKRDRAFHGMVRALLNNMVVGVSKGFQKDLEIVGVGWRCQMQGNKLVLNLGYSHPVEYVPPQGVEITTDGPTKISVKGIDKQAVGQVAALIRGFRPPEPYKGKGVRYAGETIIRKAGKAGAK